jgi:hypothetical protein
MEMWNSASVGFMENGAHWKMYKAFWNNDLHLIIDA